MVRLNKMQVRNPEQREGLPEFLYKKATSVCKTARNSASGVWTTEAKKSPHVILDSVVVVYFFLKGSPYSQTLIRRLSFRERVN